MGKFSFYREQPLFGLDIGHSSIKVMQLDYNAAGQPRVLGYGDGPYSPKAINGGNIVDYKGLAASLHDLFEEKLHGVISTKKVACSIPTARSFSRSMKLPAMNEKDISEAVHLEAEQYIPVPAANLYIDFEITRQEKDGIELLMVATPKNIIDSHIKFLEGVGLDPVALEPTMNAAARFFGMAADTSAQPSILIDFGSDAIDLAVFDKTMLVNSTVNGGSENMTKMIAQGLDISDQQAYDIKTKYGIGVSDHQKQIQEALSPLLDNLAREVQKMGRYYDERVSTGQHKISQAFILGGGATMPGLSQYLSGILKLPVHTLDPWSQVDFGGLPAPADNYRSVFVTVAGEALLNPKDLIK